MRRSLQLTAVSVAAFAWALSAPGAGAKEREVFYTITLQEAHLSATQPSAAGSAAKVDGFTVKQGVKPMQHKLDQVLVKSWSASGGGAPSPGFPGGVTVAAGDVNSTGGDHEMRMVAVRHLVAACLVGKRYPTATMEGGGKRYKLTDVRITGCDGSGPEKRITFVYGKMDVK